MSPQAGGVTIPGYHTGPTWVLWPPDSKPASVPLELIAGDSVMYGLESEAEAWQIVISVLSPASADDGPMSAAVVRPATTSQASRRASLDLRGMIAVFIDSNLGTRGRNASDAVDTVPGSSRSSSVTVERSEIMPRGTASV